MPLLIKLYTPNPVSMDSKMNTVSSPPVIPTIYKGLFLQVSTAESLAPSYSRTLLPTWLSCYTHLLLSLFLWLEIYCFKLNFWILLQLSISSFEKSIFRALLVTKTQILINLMPLSSRHAFSLSSFILNYFHDFLDFPQAWTKFMISNNGIYRINSCKIN